MPTGRVALTIAAALCLAVVRPAAAQTPVGPSFRVDAHTTGDQVFPAVAVERSSGQFVVVWANRIPFVAVSDIAGQRYAADGSPKEAEFRVSSHPHNFRSIQLAADGAGGWVAAWESAAGYDISARRHLFAGAPASLDLTANSFVPGIQANPSVAADGSGNFVVVWEDSGKDGDGYGIFGQRFDAAGAPVGDEFQVNEVATGNQGSPSVAMDGAGNFVVVWAEAALFAQRFDASGRRVGAEFQVNEPTTGIPFAPKVALDGTGNVLVVWQSQAGPRLLSRRFDASGVALGSELVVDATGSSVTVAGSAAGFVVVWLSSGGTQGFGQRIDADGSWLGSTFSIDPAAPSLEQAPSVAMDDSGGFVVAWSGGEGASHGIFAQRFTSVTPTAKATAARTTVRAGRAPIVVLPALPTEPALTLLARESFEADVLADWVLPAGWTRTAIGNGFALRLTPGDAGLTSAAQRDGILANVAVLAEFTFTDATGTAQLITRNSAAGAYVGELDAAGLVTLQKRDGVGAVLASWSAAAPPQAVAGSARALRLSTIGGVLRVSVDGAEVLAVDDAAPLPPGANRIGAVFTAPEGALTLDNYLVWIPSEEVVREAPAEASVESAPLAAAALPPPPAVPTNDEPPSDNDEFAAAKVVPGVRYTHIANNAAGTPNEVNEPVPSCGVNVTHTVWYKFTPLTGGPYLLTSFGSSINTVLAVYSGSDTATLDSLAGAEVGCSDDVAGSVQARLTLALVGAQAYYIQLGSSNGSVGDFKFHVIDPSDALVPGTPVISTSAIGAPTTPLGQAARTNDAQPVVAWTPKPTVTPYNYLVQVSTVATFASIVTFGVVLEPTRFWEIAPALPDPVLLAGQKYYWRVTAKNYLGQSSAPSAAYSFTLDRNAPAPPPLISPVVGGVVSSLRPTLRWGPVADATLYGVRIATNSSCSSPIPDGDVATTATSFTPAFDVPQGEYWFCAQSRDAAGNPSGFGEIRRFVINISLSPANGATVIAKAPSYTSNVVLTWTKVAGATYNIDVAPDASFTLLVVDNLPVTGSSYTLTGQPSGTYYWRVAVSGARLPSALARSFTISPALPAAPLIQTTGALPGAVTSAGFTNDQTPLFDWTVPANWVSPAPGASITYEFQLATNSAFSPLVGGAVTGLFDSSFDWAAVADLPATPGTTYYWRVRAITNLGLAGAFSVGYRFTLDTVAPSAPQLVLPAVNGTSPSLRPMLKWNAVGGANRYGAQITTNSSCTSSIAAGEVATTTFTPSPDVPQGEYWFCVQSRDAAGNWSGFIGEKRRFVINVSLLPANGAKVIAKAPSYRPNVVLTWTKVAGATYSVEIASDASFTALVASTGPITATSYTLTGQPSGTYYWRVTVSGSTVPGPLARSFFITPGLPAAPLIQTTGALLGAVKNAGLTNDTSPIFDWTVPANWVSPAPGTSITYEFQLATHSSFSSPIAGSPVLGLTQSDFEWVLGDLPATPGTTYYWRVRAVTNLGLAGAFSVPFRFTLDTVDPGLPPSLLAPADLAVSTSARPTFSWAAGTNGAARYRFEIADEPSFASPVYSALVGALSHVPIESGQQGVYYWHVYALDAAGNETDTPTGYRTVTIDYRTAPAAGKVIANTNPAGIPVLFTWKAPIGAPVGTTYIIEIDADLDGTAETTFGPVTTLSVTSAALLPGDYQYRLVGSNGLGTSGWRGFTVSAP